MANEFIFGTDGHAGLSHRKAGELLGVNRTSIWDLVKTDVFTLEERENINRYGIRWEALIKLCTYYSTARRVTAQARQRCIDLLRDVEDFQVLIDELANGDSQPQQSLPLALNTLSHSSELLDFIPGNDGHVGLSQRKAAELLKIAHTTVLRAVTGGALFTADEAEVISQQGIRGGALVKMARYFSQSSQVSPETRQHCLDLLEKAAIIGVQIFIDRLAGIQETPQPQQPAAPVLPSQDRLGVIEQGISLLDRLGGLDERTKLALSDCVRNVLFENDLSWSAPAKTEQDREWTISDRIVALGYKPQGLEVLKGIGTIVGRLYRQRHNGQEPPKRGQYVDGAPRSVNSYRTADLDIVDQTIRAKLGEPPSNIRRLPPAR